MSLDLYLTAYVDTGAAKPLSVEVWWRNCTHNLSPMWNKAGVYEALYKSTGKKAGELVAELEAGLKHMVENASEYQHLNPENGWGSYEGAVWFLREFLDACREHPKAIVECSS